MPSTLELRLRGGGGEPVDLRRTLNSHGFVDLAPFRWQAEAGELEATFAIPHARPRTVRIGPGRRGWARIDVTGPRLGAAAVASLESTLRRVLRLDDDLSAFYAVAAADADLAWVTTGAGRMVQAPTVFEDVVKTVCTTNCTWSATVRMVNAIVTNLGEPAVGAAPDGPWGRAFPTPEAMASAGEGFYRDVARAGYRGPYLIEIARSVAAGELDLEAFRAPADGLPDDEVERRLLALPGVGPYAAAHIMMTLGRYSRLILDSWTRPTFARLTGRKSVSDAAILRRFKRFGPYAGLAFWLVLTRDWVE